MITLAFAVGVLVGVGIVIAVYRLRPVHVEFPDWPEDAREEMPAHPYPESREARRAERG